MRRAAPAFAWASVLPCAIEQSVSDGPQSRAHRRATTWKTSSWPALASNAKRSTSPGRSIVPSNVAGSDGRLGLELIRPVVRLLLGDLGIGDDGEVLEAGHAQRRDHADRCEADAGVGGDRQLDVEAVGVRACCRHDRRRRARARGSAPPSPGRRRCPSASP